MGFFAMTSIIKDGVALDLMCKGLSPWFFFEEYDCRRAVSGQTSTAVRSSALRGDMLTTPAQAPPSTLGKHENPPFLVPEHPKLTGDHHQRERPQAHNFVRQHSIYLSDALNCGHNSIAGFTVCAFLSKCHCECLLSKFVKVTIQ